jgi:hypothetical protein
MSDHCTCCSDTTSGSIKIAVKIKPKFKLASTVQVASLKKNVIVQDIALPDGIGNTIPKHGAGGKSFNGYPIRILKSAIQKYIRRGDQRAVSYAIDYGLLSIFLYPRYTCQYEGVIRVASIKGAITNLINRLRIIAIEDVGIGEPNAPYVIEDLLGPLDRFKNSVNVNQEPTFDKLIKPIMLATDYLRRCPKIRAISYIKTAFTLPPYYDTYEIQSEKLSLLAPAYPDLITDASVSLNALLDINSGLEFFAALSRYLKDNVSSLAINHVWSILRKSANYDKYAKILNVLHTISKAGVAASSYNEKIIAMYQAALLLILKPDLGLVGVSEPDQGALVKIYNDVVSMNIPDYEPQIVEDMHTNKGGSLIEFAYIGSYIINPMLGYLPYRYDLLYNEMKVLSHFGRGNYQKHEGLPIIPYHASQIKEQTDLVKAQLLTSASKVPTYVGQFHIYKGPYSSKQFHDPTSRFNRCIKYTEMLQDMEDTLGLKGFMRTTLPIRYIAQVEPTVDADLAMRGYYLVWDNIGDWSALKTETKSSAINPEGLVMTKSSMIKNLSDYIPLTHRHRLAATQHLYLRYVCGLGDSGPWNILVRYNPTGNMDGQIVVGVDLEDMRGAIKATDTPVHLLVNKYSAKYQTMFGSSVQDIVQLTPELGQQWGDDVAERVRLFRTLSNAPVESLVDPAIH